MECIGPEINKGALNLKWSHKIWKLGNAKIREKKYDIINKYMIKIEDDPKKK